MSCKYAQADGRIKDGVDSVGGSATVVSKPPRSVKGVIFLVRIHNRLVPVESQ